MRPSNGICDLLHEGSAASSPLTTYHLYKKEARRGGGFENLGRLTTFFICPSPLKCHKHPPATFFQIIFIIPGIRTDFYLLLLAIIFFPGSPPDDQKEQESWWSSITNQEEPNLSKGSFIHQDPRCCSNEFRRRLVANPSILDEAISQACRKN